jgi:hypothetical protein
MNRKRADPAEEPKVRDLAQASFSAGEAAELAGLTYGTLNLWAREKILEPSIQTAAGHGSRRSYSFQDVVALAVGAQCRIIDVGLKTTGQLMGFIQKSEKLLELLASDWSFQSPMPGVVEFYADGAIDFDSAYPEWRTSQLENSRATISIGLDLVGLANAAVEVLQTRRGRRRGGRAHGTTND